MDWIYGIQWCTLLMCCVNYGLVVYNSDENIKDWNFGSTTSIGWLMAVLGWVNVVLLK